MENKESLFLQLQNTIVRIRDKLSNTETKRKMQGCEDSMRKTYLDSFPFSLQLFLNSAMKYAVLKDLVLLNII